jgi:AmiR/NasT family two-component response regulator
VGAPFATALRSRATIKQATGLLMHREGLGADDAGAMLRQISSQQECQSTSLAPGLLDRAGPH